MIRSASAANGNGGDVRDVRLADALGERYLAYALSTIVSRSLPDVRDGLKPVHRRLLFAMRQLKLDPDKGFKKCARVVGDVIGKYHPHGDASVYEALVRLAQEFAVRYPLVDGQGNFGNIDGDNAAAMRYTEARLTEVAAALMDGLDEDAADFRPTYDGEEEEPVVMPSGLPNLLANGSAGIAVGMATSIPPHNLAELCDALIHLIQHPDCAVETLVELVPGPDFPTGGVLAEGRDAVLEAYRTGRGGFRVRAKWEVEQMRHGLFQVVVTEIPYQVQKSRLIEKVAELLTAKKLPLLADIRDESAAEVRVVLEPRNRTVDPAMMMEQLFRQTDLESRFPLNMNVLDGGIAPRVMNLKEVLQAYLDHRHEVLLRISRHRRDKIERRLEILGGLLVAYLNLDEVIRIIREEDEPKSFLMKAFKLTEVQAEAILNMRLRQLRRLEEMEIRRENESLEAERATIDILLGDESRRWKAIRDQVAALKKRFGPHTPLGKRRTAIGEAPSAAVVPIEAFIEKEPITVLCSEKGWIRALKGHAPVGDEVKYKEGDAGRFVLQAQTTDKLVVFASNGRFYTLSCDKLPGGRGHGEPLRLMIDLPQDHDVLDMQVHDPARRLVVASSIGRGFQIEEKDVIAQTRNGRQVLNVEEGETAALCVAVPEGADSLAVLGENRKLLVFPLEELPTMARGRGVLLQKYKDGGIADAKAFRMADGLTWALGDRKRTETDLRRWLGHRAQSGQLPPTGFPRNNRFG
ncbi:MAG: DNA topoisomerase IV subunit A [Magnetospirillum sp. WYHS-4]